MLTFADAAAKAQKILGPDAKVPAKLSPAVQDAIKTRNTAADKYATSVKALQASLLAYQDSASAVALAAKQFARGIASDDFGVDKKSADGKKKRADAQKPFDAYFDEADKRMTSLIKSLDELDKHLDQLADYKPPPSPVS